MLKSLNRSYPSGAFKRKLQREAQKSIADLPGSVVLCRPRFPI